MSALGGLKEAPPVQVFLLNKQYEEEQDPEKVNLTVGAYRNEDGDPWILPVVKKVEAEVIADKKLTHEYLPILGLESFRQEAPKLVLSADNPVFKENRVLAVQTLSGTGAVRLALDALRKLHKYSTVLFSKPTWPNHQMIARDAGFQEILEYSYWDDEKRNIAFDQLICDLRTAPDRSVVVLHACAHNPTGLDPTQEQWKKISTIIKRLLEASGIIIGSNYLNFAASLQGFASGDLHQDAWAVRYFIQQGHETMIAQSFAKNFGLYNERVGCLTIVASDSKVISPLQSHIQLLVRANYSNPPAHGAHIVSRILKDEQLRSEWVDCIKMMSNRIKEMRSSLVKYIEENRVPGNWSHITRQIGMFSFTGLSPAQCDRLIKMHKVFLMRDGRISLAGLHAKNVAYVAGAIAEVVRMVRSEKRASNGGLGGPPFFWIFWAGLLVSIFAVKKQCPVKH